MSTETKKTETAPDGVAQSAPTEQQATQPGTPRRFATGQTVCNVKNEKGKLCNGHLKQMNTAHEASVYLRGDDVLHQCQTCGALYMGPPMGHVRDPSKQRRYVEKDLAAILQAAGGTLPAYDYPVPGWRGVAPKRVAPAKPATVAPPVAAPSTSALEGETPEQKKARLLAQHQAKRATGDAPKASPAATSSASEAATVDAASASTSGTDSSAQADSHRPAAEAQAATGQASAAPLSPAAATASPAAGAETVSDLAPEASTELTPGAPKDERKESDAQTQSAAPTEAVAPPRKRAASTGKLLAIAPHLAPPPGETHEEKIARLRSVVEEAKRRAGKLD